MAKCVFCGVDGATKEHVFPRWMHPLLPKYSQSFTRDIRALAGSKGLRQEATQHIRIGRPIIASQPPIACGRCNNGWMSKLHAPVKETLTKMILGQQAFPSEEFWSHLVPWLAMITMTGEYIDRRYIAIPQSDRDSLFQHCHFKAPLSLRGWKFGISCFIGSELQNPTYRHYRQRLGSETVSQSTTFRFGELILTADSGMDGLPGLGQVLEESDFRKVVMRFGPEESTPQWPPGIIVNDLMAEAVTRRTIRALQRGYLEQRPEFIAAGEEVAAWVAENVDLSKPEGKLTRNRSSLDAM